MVKLTKRQIEILNLIQNQIDTVGSPPTRAEIASKMGFCSPNAAEDHLRALAKKGVIELVPGTSRGIRLLKNGGLPVVGKVAAGLPILAEENIETYYKVDHAIFTPNADYLLREQGCSMEDLGIYNGDLLAVHATTEYLSGQVIIARLDNEVTVKRFYQNGNKVTLQAGNTEFDPIEVDLEKQSLTIEGIVVGVIRVFSHK